MIEKLGKLILALVVVAVVLIVISYVGLMIYVNSQGKSFIESYLSTTYGVQAEIKQIKLSFPFTLVISDFSCGDVSFSHAYLRLERVKFDPVTPIFSRLQIDGLKVQVVRQRDEVTIEPFWRYKIAASKDAPLLDQVDVNRKVDISSPLTASAVPKRDIPFSLIIREILLKQITLAYTDYTFVPPLEFTLKDTNVKLKDFNLPKLLMFYFDVSASMETETRKMPDILKADGWLDWFYKNMEAQVKVDRYDYLTFDKQYSRGFKAYDLDLEQAFLSLLVELRAADNDLVISGEVMFEDVAFKNDPLRPDKVESLQNALAALKKKDDNPYFNLPPLKTKLDHPSIDMGQVTARLQQLTMQNVGDVLDRVLKGETDIKNIEDDPAVKTIKNLFRGVEAIIKDKFKSEE
ncbi:MAG: DUF748 domain-containing protein [Candidatus Omnitrophica bacterium]|nr:DUF748 domain-containing protein [Candidatus Omnitrophota bacterium]